MLLAVYLPMVMALMFHVHEREVQEEAACGLCVSHTPHHGHLHDGDVSDHDCLLCRFSATLYVAAKELSVSVCNSFYVVLPSKEEAGFLCRHSSALKTRAPPHESDVVA